MLSQCPIPCLSRATVNGAASVLSQDEMKESCIAQSFPPWSRMQLSPKALLEFTHTARSHVKV